MINYTSNINKSNNLRISHGKVVYKHPPRDKAYLNISHNGIVLNRIHFSCLFSQKSISDRYLGSNLAWDIFCHFKPPVKKIYFTSEIPFIMTRTYKKRLLGGQKYEQYLWI